MKMTKSMTDKVLEVIQENLCLFQVIFLSGLTFTWIFRKIENYFQKIYGTQNLKASGAYTQVESQLGDHIVHHSFNPKMLVLEETLQVMQSNHPPDAEMLPSACSTDYPAVSEQKFMYLKSVQDPLHHKMKSPGSFTHQSSLKPFQ